MYLCSTFSLFYINSSKLPAGYSNPRNKFILESYVLAQRCVELPESLSALTRLEPWELKLSNKKKNPARLDSKSTGVAGRHLLATSPAHTW